MASSESNPGNLIKYIIIRLLFVIPVFLGVSLIVFIIEVSTPGDPVLIRLGFDPTATPAVIAAARAQLGLNKPIYIQYLNYLNLLIHGNLGNDIQTGQPVIVEIGQAFPRTLILAVLSILLAVAIGLPAGVISAMKQNSAIDKAVSIASLSAASIPNFWLALILIFIFSYTLRLLPIFGYGTPANFVLPTIALGTALAGVVTRFTRSSMLEVLRQDFIKTAISKGIRYRIVLVRHALKNALIPIITVIGLQFGTLLSGAFFVEYVFGYPGIGRLAVDAIQEKNYPVVQGAVLVVSVSFVLVNVFVDVIYTYIDPRVHYR
jgi:peptide/nickel transport system permease protein